jgi:hypothetical protein
MYSKADLFVERESLAEWGGWIPVTTAATNPSTTIPICRLGWLLLLR